MINKPFQSRMKMIIILLAIFLINSIVTIAQPTRYTRKSIAYIDALLYSRQTNFLDKEDENYYLRKIHEGIRLARFDYNTLPAKVQANFKKELQKKGDISEEEITQLLERTIVPEIIKILDIEKEIRAKNLVTESQRNSFIALKAKEMGITATQLEQVMNSSFLYVPFLSKYKTKKEKDKKTLSVSLAGGLIWYQVITGDQPGVKKITTVRSEASSSQQKEDGESYSKIKKDLLRSLSFIMALNLQTRTREIDMFKLMAPIAEVEKRNIRFPLGKAEGIKMDQPYFVGEWIERTDGSTRFDKSGFVRIGTVADNSRPGQHLSSAWAIKKGDWFRGMSVIEHPRLGIDFAFKPRIFDLKVKEGIFMSEDKDATFYAVFSDFEGAILGLDCDIQFNVAPITKKRQTFVVIGGTGGIAPVHNKVYTKDEFNLFNIISIYKETEQENAFAGYFNGYMGYMKKFYLGPFALHGQLLTGVQGLSVSGKYEDNDVKIMNLSFGGRVNMGLEYAVNIDWNIGVFAGYNFFPPINWWRIKYQDEEVDVANYSTTSYPKISSISPTYGFYIHYSIPSLSFNPFSMIGK